MLVDYHIHTSLSDGKGKHEEFLGKAAEKNMSEIGFSDHFSILDTDWNTSEKDIPFMKEKIEELKSNNHSPVEIKFGAEIDYIPGKETEIEALINSLPLDYVIGSVHFIGDWNFDTSPKQFKGKNIEELYEKYFNLLTEAAKTGLYDILGHADLIKKFDHRLESTPVDMYRQVIEAAKEYDMVIELNTNGRNKPCKEFYPDICFMELCREYDIPVMINSDAHTPNQVGQYFDDAVKLLKGIGYSETATFSNRKRKMIQIS